jgi:hypothetical protein
VISLKLIQIHREAARLGSQDATAEEKLDRVSSEKRRSKLDANEPHSPKIRPKNKEEAAEEETKGKREEKEEVEEEEEKRQASYDRHRNAFAQFRARYPDILAEYLAVSEQIQGMHGTSLLTYVADNNHNLPCNLREPQLQVQSVLRHLRDPVLDEWLRNNGWNIPGRWG